MTPENLRILVEKTVRDILNETSLNREDSNSLNWGTEIFSQDDIVIAANWKMNMTISQAKGFTQVFNPKLQENSHIIICPPIHLVSVIANELRNKGIFVGCQNYFNEVSGAYTGEISISMVKELGCEFGIVGHSERRHIFGESDTLLNKKVHAALEHRIKPILCVGETEKERESGNTFRVIKNQLRGALYNVPAHEAEKITIAYEPVWAIGTGKTATPELAQEVHAFIREELSRRFNHNVAKNMRILYGGSVKAKNAASLIKMKDINGFLVGGAGLKPKEFSAIYYLSVE